MPPPKKKKKSLSLWIVFYGGRRAKTRNKQVNMCVVISAKEKGKGRWGVVEYSILNTEAKRRNLSNHLNKWRKWAMWLFMVDSKKREDQGQRQKCASHGLRKGRSPESCSRVKWGRWNRAEKAEQATGGQIMGVCGPGSRLRNKCFEQTLVGWVLDSPGAWTTALPTEVVWCTWSFYRYQTQGQHHLLRSWIWGVSVK